MKQVLKSILAFGIVGSISMLLMGCASTANFNVNSAGYLNPDINGQASPVLVTVYQLKNGYAFSQADYESLTANAAQVLGNDIVDKNSFEVQPSASFSTSEKVYPDTKFIGVVAAYRDPNSVSWHKVVPLKKAGASIHIKLNLEAEGIALIPS
jgi:type VI secretion system protein VasD